MGAGVKQDRNKLECELEDGDLKTKAAVAKDVNTRSEMRNSLRTATWSGDKETKAIDETQEA